MNINIFEAYADTMESNCELYRFMGEFDRITEFTGYLIEKLKHIEKKEILKVLKLLSKLY